jgi:hypothetical protein
MMLRAWSLVWLTLVSLSLPGAARGQEEGAAAEEGPRSQRIEAVERGTFVTADAGLALLAGPIQDRSYGLAPRLGVFVGHDLAPFVNLSLGATALAFGVSSDPATPRPRGDLMVLAPMLRVDFAVLTTERNFVWVRGEGGFAFGLPGELEGQAYGGNGPIFGGGAGFEHFTRLRRFSIGVHAGALVLTRPATAVIVSITPTLKYTF